MALAKFIAGQLRQPSGLFGKLVVARILNRGNAAMNELTVKLLELTPDDRVLEVGFGGGDLLNRLIPLVTAGRVAGVDFSQAMTDLCAKRFAALVRTAQLDLRCANVEKLPYAEGEFTKACTVNTIYFWPAPVAALREVGRVLRDGGKLVVCFNPKATAEKLPYTRHGFTLYDPEQVRPILREAGFGDVTLVPGSSRLGPFVCAVCTK